jgi:predicted esterase
MFPLPRFPKFSLLAAVGVGFLCALFWAKAKDPFERIRFSLRSAGGEKTAGMVFLRKPVSKHATVLYLYDSRENLQRSGLPLRQLAELGLAAVCIEYNQTNQAAFDGQFEALLEYVRKQAWANTHAIAWFGYGAGAQRLLSFAAAHPQTQPQLFICLNGGILPDGTSTDRTLAAALAPPPSRCLLVHGRQDEVFPLDPCEKLAAGLREQGAKVDLCILDGQGHHFGRDQDVVYRAIGDYTAAHFGLSGTRSTQADDSHWAYWIPAVLMVLWFVWWVCPTILAHCFHSGTKLSWKGKAFYGFTVCVALVALGQTAFHVGLPSRAISLGTVELARTVLVREELRKDFDYLANDPAWSGKPLRQLLQHVELANLQRKEFYENLDSEMYREFVLSPRTGATGASEWGWRRSLWEAFYPRVRKESDPVEAAQVVMRFLRERVGISHTDGNGVGVETTWKFGQTQSAGFEEVYVAALRSVGIAARLDDQGRAELWTGDKWLTAPQPLVRLGFPFQAIPSKGESGE